LPAVFAAIQYICGPSRRATAAAIVMASLNAVGLTLGPLATGWISDMLALNFGILSLRYALMTMTFLLLPASILILVATRRFADDAE
jgi:MFS family permease